MRLLEAFQERQRKRPELVVRPWWSSDVAAVGGRASAGSAAIGFVVEYCPRGIESAEIAVRPGRVRVEVSGGVHESPLDLSGGWHLDGTDVQCAELLVNHLLGIADRLLDETA
jgi:hypothetical protein